MPQTDPCTELYSQRDFYTDPCACVCSCVHVHVCAGVCVHVGVHGNGTTCVSFQNLSPHEAAAAGGGVAGRPEAPHSIEGGWSRKAGLWGHSPQGVSPLPKTRKAASHAPCGFTGKTQHTAWTGPRALGPQQSSPGDGTQRHFLMGGAFNMQRRAGQPPERRAQSGTVKRVLEAGHLVVLDETGRGDMNGAQG